MRGEVMTRVSYMVRNRSASEGQYFLNGEYHTLMPGELKKLHNKPVNATANITVSTFKQETGTRTKGVLNMIPTSNSKPDKVMIQDVPDVVTEKIDLDKPNKSSKDKDTKAEE